MTEIPNFSKKSAAVRDAKQVLRLSRTGALATLDEGQPLNTLVGIATDWDGAPLFLLSDLSRHSRNLAADNRASLLLTGNSAKGDPLNHPRITLNGRVLRYDAPAAKQRYIRRNPKAKLYADFADFSLRRFQIEAVHFNGGFGRADPVSVTELLTPEGDFSVLAAAEDDLLRAIASLDKESVNRLAGGSSAAQTWRPVGIDPEGAEVLLGRTLVRIDFPAPAFEPLAWRLALQSRLNR